MSVEERLIFVISSLINRKASFIPLTYKTRKEKIKMASPSPSLVNPGTVQIIAQVEPEKSATVTTREKKAYSDKSTPSKEASKKKSSKSSAASFSDYISALDKKWSQRFIRLEALLLAKRFTMQQQELL